MTRAEIKNLMWVRKKDSFGTKRIIVHIRTIAPHGWPFAQWQWPKVEPLLQELKTIRSLAKEKSLSLKA